MEERRLRLKGCCFQLVVLYRLLYCLLLWIVTGLQRAHCFARVVARLLRSLLCNRLSLREQNRRRGAQASDRVVVAKTQSIQIAYTGRGEAIQNSGLHKQIVSIGGSCIAYLNCLIQIANHSDCLALCVKGHDRMSKIAENRSVSGFERLLQVVESTLKALGCDRASNTVISNSNRS